ncbi:MAG: 16S rRNA (guanine(527)-N(7))-methyltransferase RsmG [Limnoraphis robusta]|uniref:Ribosomal RNA small subunit methyltransferase G n=1 Tax=Limnoraphis robusta CS-951 TaxID=1637645 RepID=A0A0F5YA94_9CYAN|nr:16S rRNA (guanine(527)-N(7))-methyltransferase RsmG [Limnoraphis robusta]KKD35537.1 16S rRNA methyltransferase [Limnoraphis robusta CS-951]KMW69875.1 16S rRNA methyltransferase [Limnoraphis robusta CS-951]
MNETERPMILEMTSVWQETLNWQPTAVQQQLFQRLYEGILAGNESLNLTRITEYDAFWEKHLWDSLAGIAPFFRGEWDFSASTVEVIDIGTGAGFPGLPVAIAVAESSVMLLDSTRKKITFLESLIETLEVKNARGFVGRAEQVNQQLKFKRKYHLALVRAVATASVCAEYALPFCTQGGRVVLYRGHWTVEEEKALQLVVKNLGGEIESIRQFTTPLTESIRHCIDLKKLSE